MTDEEAKKKEEEQKKAAEPEPDSQELRNPSRVLRAQEKKIKYKDDGSYYPVLDTRFSGFIVLRGQKQEGEEPETYWDDEEVDPTAPNPNLYSEFELPAEFEFDPAVQNAAD